MRYTLPKGTKVHPTAAGFPMLTDEDLESLAASIKAIGLQVPIVYNKAGMLLDGRNRLIACGIAGVEPTKRVLEDGVDEIDVILGLNLEHRSTKQGEKVLHRARAYIDKWVRTHPGEAWDW